MLLTFELFHNLVGLFRHLLVYILTLLIIFVDMIRLCQCFLKIALHQQIHSLGTILHTAGSIDTRTYFKNDVAYANLTPS